MRRKSTPITDERRAELAAMPYAQYLRSPEWQARRHVVLKIAGDRCMVCNSPVQLNVHHRRYVDDNGLSILGAEKMMDLCVLCETCHHLFHKHGRLRR